MLEQPHKVVLRMVFICDHLLLDFLSTQPPWVIFFLYILCVFEIWSFSLFFDDFNLARTRSQLSVCTLYHFTKQDRGHSCRRCMSSGGAPTPLTHRCS